MRRLVTRVLLFALLGTGTAHAALTDSEKAQIQGFVKSGELKNASRIRALVARPDLSADEAAEPLSAGFGAVSFDDKREKLAREILLGPGSTAARSELATPLVKAVLARATAALGAMPSAETGPEALKADAVGAEVVRIHRFVTEAIANAGRPPADGHDATAGFRDDALKASLEAYRAHFERHAAVLKPGTRLSASLVPVRAQASLAVVDLSRGLLQRHEVSALLGLTGTKKALFERHGTLLEDGSTASEARLALAARYLDLAPRAASGLSLWLISKAPVRDLGSRFPRAAARVSLGSVEGAPIAGPLWPAEVEPSAPDRELAEVAYSAAWIVTRAAFAQKPELAKAASALRERTLRAGEAGRLTQDLEASVLAPESGPRPEAHGASATLFLAHALRAVLLDAPRALDLALSRAAQGRDEPLGAFVLALSALAATGPGGDEIAVGRTEPGGAVAPEKLSGVKLFDAFVTGFELEGKKVEVTLGSEGQATAVKVDGAAPRLSKLTRARLVPKAGDQWVAGTQRWEKLGGGPRGLAVDDGRFVLGAAEQSAGFDAVVTGEPEKEPTVHARLSVKTRGGGLLVRGQPGDKSYDGIALLVSRDPTPKASLILVDGKAKAVELAPPIELPAAGANGYLLVLSAKGQRVSASVDGKKLEAKLERGVGSGKSGLMVMGGGLIEVTGFGRGAPKPEKKAEKQTEPKPKKAEPKKAEPKKAEPKKAEPQPKKKP